MLIDAGGEAGSANINETQGAIPRSVEGSGVFSSRGF